MKTKQPVLYRAKSDQHVLGFVVYKGKVYAGIISNAKLETKDIIYEIIELGAKLTESGVWQDISKTKQEQESEG